MDLENGARPTESSRWKAYRSTLLLAYQSIGVVYGDLIISPIYVYKSTFSGKLQLHEEDVEVLGVLSLVFWTLTLIPLCKYIVFVLGADDNGEGGTFALYSLLCRRSKLGLLSAHSASEHLSSYSIDTSLKETRTSFHIKKFFEKHQSSRIMLLLIVLLGTSMVIGDGVLTPTMSVLSAVSGIRIKAPELHENYTVFTACVVLIGLFALQHYGTHRVGFLFAPILIAWLCCICGVGIYNIIKWNPGVICGLSPSYIYLFFKKTGKDGWSSLGGVVLCVTGAEAMFADLGHFSKLSIRGAFVFVYPCLVVAYMGEAAYLSRHKEDLQSSFYKSLPDGVFWPVFVIATLASVAGSQAIISATFSLISQCRALGCFPRVKIVHTSSRIHGQIYIPEVNWILMFLCLCVTIGFKNTHMIGNAYGLAVITVMFVTTCLMFLIITTVWKKTIFTALLFVIIFGSIELLYFSACLAKIHDGGWFPLILSLLILLSMSVWLYGTLQKQAYELQNKVSMDQLLSLAPSLGLVRVPGICIVYSNTTTSGVPRMFAHFVTNFPAFHRVLIFVSLQGLMVPRVPQHEQFLIGRIGPPEYHLFHCNVRYGYRDTTKNYYDFENQVLMKLEEFLQQQNDELGEPVMINGSSTLVPHPKKVRFKVTGVKKEVSRLLEERDNGIAYMMGHTNVVASEHSSLVKKIVINLIYGFLRRNCRRPAVAADVPTTSLVEVGMVYHV